MEYMYRNSNSWRELVMQPAKWISLAVIFFSLVLFSTRTPAATIQQLDMDTMLENAELIFHGRVVQHTVLPAPDGRAISTHVTFEVDDVIKGDYQGKRVTLTFLGGSYDGATMVVHGLVLPGVGEEGVYFVETLSHTQVNPLLGWAQGHFLVDKASQVMTAEDKKPVYQLERQEKADPAALSHGIAKGVRTEPATTGAKPLGVKEFKARLRTMIGEL